MTYNAKKGPNRRAFVGGAAASMAAMHITIPSAAFAQGFPERFRLKNPAAGPLYKLLTGRRTT